MNSEFQTKTVAIAPMLDWTDKHYRYFMRKMTKYTELYTEMVVADAIIHGNLEQLLGYNFEEQPLVVQLGGSDPKKLAQASRICEQYGYSEINLNLGCPSDRVKSGNFGACLMYDAPLVANCVKAMQDSVAIPVTVKTRIGVDNFDSYDFMRDFILTIADTGCNKFIIHARSAILKGLSPKKNREIPPLKYEYVYRLKRENPHLEIMINGGIRTFEEMNGHLYVLDGVMVGREAYHNPFLFNYVDCIFYNEYIKSNTRLSVAYSMALYLEQQLSLGVELYKITRHMVGLFHGCANAKLWRNAVTQEIRKHNSVDWYIKLLDSLVD